MKFRNLIFASLAATCVALRSVCSGSSEGRASLKTSASHRSG